MCIFTSYKQYSYILLIVSQILLWFVCLAGLGTCNDTGPYPLLFTHHQSKESSSRLRSSSTMFYNDQEYRSPPLYHRNVRSMKRHRKFKEFQFSSDTFVLTQKTVSQFIFFVSNVSPVTETMWKGTQGCTPKPTFFWKSFTIVYPIPGTRDEIQWTL